MQITDRSRADFNERVLPWIVTAVALIIYLITLNRWVTADSLPVVAKVTRWDWWSLTLQAPLFYTLTWPIRWLPLAWQPVALNVFSAICAAGTLGLLARSVALLPYDRTREQRQREHSEYSLLTIPAAWVPPVLAALACGLQLTFWQHAIAATGEAFNGLLFAYLVYCLLAYRLDQEDSQLTRLAFVYGLAVTNNWAMIGFFPVLLVALVWVQGFRFFRWKFLLRLAGFGVLGLLLYLLLPLVEKFVGGSELSLWELLRMEWGLQKGILLGYPKYIVMLCALTSLLPLLIIGFRWPSSFGDTSIVGAFMTSLMFHVVHVLFFGICIWVMFDPPFSPRALGFGLPFLPFYFLSALSIGYFSGYFLLIFGTEPERPRHHVSPTGRLAGYGLIGLVWVALVAVPVGLVYKNWPFIRANNGAAMVRLATDLAQYLPPQGGLVLSDEPLNLLLVQGILDGSGAASRYLFLDTRSLPYLVYHRTLLKHYPKRWPDFATRHTVPEYLDNASLAGLMITLGRTNEICYLHPAFNYYAEAFASQPRGLVYALKAYQPGVVTNPPPDAGAIATNNAFWTKAKADLAQLPKTPPRDERDLALSDREFVARYYSRSANYWGVEMQKIGRLPEAGHCFEFAQELNPENWVAWVNLEFNHNLRQGKTLPVELSPAMETKLEPKNNRRWEDRLNENGLFDEPRFCAKMGENFALAKPVPFIRQAAQQFIRVLSLDPSNLETQIWLANLYLKWPLPEKTLEVVQRMEANQQRYPLSLPYQIELIRLRAWASYTLTNLDAAIKELQDAAEKNPSIAAIPETLSQIYLKSGQFTNALTALEQQIRLDPGNSKALLNKGALLIELKHYGQAVAPLTQVLQADPKNNAARVNRAIAYLRSGQWEPAKEDYKVLFESLPPRELFRAYYGLGEVAYQLKNTNEAVKNYELYLKTMPRDAKNLPMDAEEMRLSEMVTNRLQELRGSAPNR